MTDLLFKAAAIAVLLGGLIFVHELGHFVAAKLLGVKVVRFSIGFGPRLLWFQRGETEYRVALLPLGGYVKMAGDVPGVEVPPEDRGRGFLEQPPWKRLVIGAAGPFMNFVLPAVVLFAMALAADGARIPAARVGLVWPGSPAAAAGLEPGDRILAVSGPAGQARPVRYFSDLSELVAPYAGQPLAFEVERDGRRLPPITIVPAQRREVNPVEVRTRGIIGITPDYAPAVVAPVRPGAAGPLAPFDLVTAVNGKPVAHAGELRQALAAAPCAPADLAVLRERPVQVPGAAVSTYAPETLRAVPTCAGGQPTIAVADPRVSTFVASVTPGGPADRAGLRRGDALAAVDGTPVRSFEDVNQLSGAFAVGRPVKLALSDGRTLTLTPGSREVRNEDTGELEQRLELGFRPDERQLVPLSRLLVETIEHRVGVAGAVRSSLSTLNEVTRLTVLTLVRVATLKLSFKTFGGPIRLFELTSQAAEEGLQNYLFLLALVSVNLGLMNLLPIPVLDGGHIVTAIIETVARRPLSVRTREVANLVGVLLLVLFMLAVFKNDIVRIVQMG